MSREAIVGQLETLSAESRAELAAELRQRIKFRESRRKLWTLYPDEGPLRREKYPKHMEFFAATKVHQEVAFIAANRSGKTLAACYALTVMMTGEYPEWWPGRRWNRPVSAWAAGEDAKAVRESLQTTLFGPPESLGTGLIPGENIIGKPTARAGVPEAFDTASIRHKSGGASRLAMKTFDQGRESFQAAKVDIIVLDEEPPSDIYSESITRTMSTEPGEPNGLMMCAFTPLKGISDVVLMFMPGGVIPVTEADRMKAWGWALAGFAILGSSLCTVGSAIHFIG